MSLGLGGEKRSDIITKKRNDRWMLSQDYLQETFSVGLPYPDVR